MSLENPAEYETGPQRPTIVTRTKIPGVGKAPLMEKVLAEGERGSGVHVSRALAAAPSRRLYLGTHGWDCLQTSAGHAAPPPRRRRSPRSSGRGHPDPARRCGLPLR